MWIIRNLHYRYAVPAKQFVRVLGVPGLNRVLLLCVAKNIGTVSLNVNISIKKK